MFGPDHREGGVADNCRGEIESDREGLAGLRITVRPQLEAAPALVTEIKAAAPAQPMILTVHEMKRLARNAAELMALSAALQTRDIARRVPT